MPLGVFGFGFPEAKGGGTVIEYIDELRNFIKDHKLVAVLVGSGFLFCLLRSFWFVIKLLFIFALLAVTVLLAFNLAGKAVQNKEQLLGPSQSMKMDWQIVSSRI